MVRVSQEAVMSDVSEFRRYAQEALRWAREAKSEKEKETLTNLAHTWMQAALQSEYVLFAEQQRRKPKV
jgi:hypothetical protein